MDKKRIFAIGSCVSRELFDYTDKYEIVEYVARTSLTSAFAGKPFFGPSDLLLETNIKSNWQRKCVRYDTRKELPALLKKSQYDAVLIDFIEERFNLIEYDDALATLTGELKLTGLHEMCGIKKIRTSNRKRRDLWIKAINGLVNIAAEKNVPVFLNKVYPAFHDKSGKRHGFLKQCRRTLYLHWLYQHTPRYVQEFNVPRKFLITDPHHEWGGSEQFHFIPAAYNCLIQQLEKVL